MERDYFWCHFCLPLAPQLSALIAGSVASQTQLGPRIRQTSLSLFLCLSPKSRVFAWKWNLPLIIILGIGQASRDSAKFFCCLSPSPLIVILREVSFLHLAHVCLAPLNLESASQCSSFLQFSEGLSGFFAQPPMREGANMCSRRHNVFRYDKESDHHPLTLTC